MLPEKQQIHDDTVNSSSNSSSCTREFFSLSKRMICKVNLQPPEAARGRRCVESLGWLVTASNDGELDLLHPFSGIQIPLPHQNTYKIHEKFVGEIDNEYFVHKTVLSANPTTNDDDYVVAIIRACGLYVGFWKPGYKSWNVVEKRYAPYQDIVYHREKFYAIDREGAVIVFDDLFLVDCPVLVRRVGGIPWEFIITNRGYILESESAGALLIVSRDVWLSDDDIDYDNYIGIDYRTVDFQVFEVDLTNQNKWKEINNLGGRSLFLGHSASISVEASKFPAIKPNCIYYTDDSWEQYYENNKGGTDMGIYHLGDGRFEPLQYKGKLPSPPIFPPVWVTPSF